MEPGLPAQQPSVLSITPLPLDKPYIIFKLPTVNYNVLRKKGKINSKEAGKGHIKNMHSAGIPSHRPSGPS